MQLKGLTVAIMGGTGKMGSWLADLLEADGLSVLRVGRNTALTGRDVVPECDMVVISVPVAHTVEVIQEIGPLVPEGSLLMDLTSVKTAAMKAMLTYSRAEVVGVHPLFGPEADPSPALRVVLCPGRGERGLNWATGFFKGKGYEISFLDPRTHDRMMGLIQGVNHFASIALALCMARSGFTYEDLTQSATSTFQERLDRIGTILGQPEELFESLLMDNPEALEFMDQYQDQAAELLDIIRKGNKEKFGRLWRLLSTFF